MLKQKTLKNKLIKKQKGSVLLDALIAFALLSVGIFGMARYQADGIKQSGTAYTQTMADLLARQMFEKMRLNPNGVTAGGYSNITNTVTDPGCITTSAGCTPATLANTDINKWYTSLSNTLPNGSGTITGGGYNTLYTVTVTWTENAPGGSVNRSWVVRGWL